MDTECHQGRREFIRGGIGVFAIASAERLFGAEAPSNRLRFAIVGCRKGGRGEDLMNNVLGRFGRSAGIDLACVCDVDARACDYAADLVERKSGVRPKKESDIRRVLDNSEIDGVLIETPDHWHAPGAVMAMRAGKHVYVEKPCAFCPREGEILLDTWRKTGRVLQVGTQRRSSPVVREAMADIVRDRLIGNPRWGKCWYMSGRRPIGRGKTVPVPEWLDWDLWQGPAPRTDYRTGIVHYDWHWQRLWGTGECGNNSVHFLDLARAMLGVDYPERTVAGGGKLWIPEDDDWVWPDMCNYTFEFPGRRVLTWEGLSCVNAKPYMGISTGAMVYGDKGSVMFKPNNTAELFDTKGNMVREWTGAEKAETAALNDNRQSGGAGDSTGFHVANFADAIRNATPVKANANAEIGVKSTQLALFANIAHRTGETLRTDPATGALEAGCAGADLWAREYERGWEI